MWLGQGDHLNFTLTILCCSYLMGNCLPSFQWKVSYFSCSKTNFINLKFTLCQLLRTCLEFMVFMLNCRANFEVINFKDIYRY